MKISVGLWGLQTPWSRPSLLGSRLREITVDACLAEDLGYRGLWLSEHRLWYDGYHPAPLQVAARLLSATSSIRIGTAVALLPQHDPIAFARKAGMLAGLSDGRFDLGVGLGYRDIEFDALGIARSDRGRLMESGMRAMSAYWQASSAENRGLATPSVWVGGASKRALARAARFDAGLILPGGWSPERVEQAVRSYRDDCSSALGPSNVAIVRHVWLSESPREEAHVVQALEDLLQHQYLGMTLLEGSDATHPGVLNPASEITIGDEEFVASEIARYQEAGVTEFIARIHNPYLRDDLIRDGMRRLAEALIP